MVATINWHSLMETSMLMSKLKFYQTALSLICINDCENMCDTFCSSIKLTPLSEEWRKQTWVFT